MAKTQTAHASGPRVFDEHEGTVHPVAVEAAPTPAPAPKSAPVPTPSPAPKPTAAAAAPGTNRYRVSLSAATPLAHQTLDVEAVSEDEARTKFNAANGISGSDHTYTVTKL